MAEQTTESATTTFPVIGEGEADAHRLWSGEIDGVWVSRCGYHGSDMLSVRVLGLIGGRGLFERTLEGGQYKDPERLNMLRQPGAWVPTPPDNAAIDAVIVEAQRAVAEWHARHDAYLARRARARARMRGWLTALSRPETNHQLVLLQVSAHARDYWEVVAEEYQQFGVAYEVERCQRRAAGETDEGLETEEGPYLDSHGPTAEWTDIEFRKAHGGRSRSDLWQAEHPL